MSERVVKLLPRMCNEYILLDGLTYNTRELRSIFPSPEGARENTSNEQFDRAYYVKPSNKSFIIPLEKITSKFGFSSPSARKPVKPGFCSAVHNTVAYFARSLDLMW